MERYRSANRWVRLRLPVCCRAQWAPQRSHGRRRGGRGWGDRKWACGNFPSRHGRLLSSKEDLRRGGLTWPPLAAVLGQELLVHLPLLLLLLDLGLLVDLLDGLGALVRSPGHPVVLEAGETRTAAEGRQRGRTASRTFKGHSARFPRLSRFT